MLGENIRKYRKANSLSQEELADRLNVSRQSISLWETGKTQPSIDVLARLASALGISADALLVTEQTEFVPQEEIGEETANSFKDKKVKAKASNKKRVAIIIASVLLVAIAVGLFVATSYFVDKTLSAEEIYTLLAQSTVEIKAADGSMISTGTGMFIDNQGTIVTNYHVVEGCSQIIATTYDGRNVTITSIKGYDENLDIAVLATNEQNSTPIQMRETAVQTGEKVYTLGSSLGLTGTFSEGIVSSAVREVNGQEYIQISAPISHGNSGGPLVDEFGKVVGITSAGFEEGQNLNLAIPISKINDVSCNSSLSVKEFYLQTSPLACIRSYINQHGKLSPVTKNKYINDKTAFKNSNYFDTLEISLKEETIRIASSKQDSYGFNSYVIIIDISDNGTVLQIKQWDENFGLVAQSTLDYLPIDDIRKGAVFDILNTQYTQGTGFTIGVAFRYAYKNTVNGSTQELIEVINEWLENKVDISIDRLLN